MPNFSLLTVRGVNSRTCKFQRRWTIRRARGVAVGTTLHMTAPSNRARPANFKTSFDYVIRYVLQSPQTTIQNLPSELIDFKRADVVEIRDSMKNLIRFYVDRATHLPMKMQVRRANQTAINEELYSNWHKFQGVMTPLLISRSTNGVKTMEIRAEMAAYNPGLPDTLFAAPVSK